MDCDARNNPFPFPILSRCSHCSLILPSSGSVLRFAKVAGRPRPVLSASLPPSSVLRLSFLSLCAGWAGNRGPGGIWQNFVECVRNFESNVALSVYRIVETKPTSH